jgi:hypothetical protein
MPGRPRSAVLHTPFDTDTRGRWVLLDGDRRGDDKLVDKIEIFRSLPNPAGTEAARWLREDAFDNDGLTKTRVLVTDERVEGYIAACYGSVDLTGGGRRGLSVPRRLQRQQVPAFLLCWIARNVESDIPGIQLMLTALGLAREAKRQAGLVAFALDPHDDQVSDMWQSEPWYFRTCKKPKEGNRPARLYLPI